MFGVYLTYCCPLCSVSVGELKKKAKGLVLAPSTQVLALHQHKLQTAKFFHESCSCLSFLTCR